MSTRSACPSSPALGDSLGWHSWRVAPRTQLVLLLRSSLLSIAFGSHMLFIILVLHLVCFHFIAIAVALSWAYLVTYMDMVLYMDVLPNLLVLFELVLLTFTLLAQLLFTLGCVFAMGMMLLGMANVVLYLVAIALSALKVFLLVLLM